MNFIQGENIDLKKRVKMSDLEFGQLRDFIYAQTGIYLPDNRKYLLENRLAHRLADLNLLSFGAYYDFLRYDPGRKQELNRLFDLITTKETSFFRNLPQLELFEHVILPELLTERKKAGEKKLRLWSAGCSTGEEPYTLAIILDKVLGPERKEWQIEIIANDISLNVLKLAKQGVYSSYSLRTTPPEIVQRYFKKLGNDNYQVKPELAEMVKFVQLSLNDKFKIKRLPKTQVIFCRNVIIYFNQETKAKVIDSFYHNLSDGGYLFLGYGERIDDIDHSFKVITYPESVVYQKK